MQPRLVPKSPRPSSSRVGVLGLAMASITLELKHNKNVLTQSDSAKLMKLKRGGKTRDLRAFKSMKPKKETRSLLRNTG